MSLSSFHCKQLHGKEDQKARSLTVFTHEIATKARPDEKSFSPSSIVASSSVKPWLLSMVIAHASVKEGCVHVKVFPDLSSHSAHTG